MFRHRQSLRRWAARVLLLWLFGIGVGIANACVVPGPAMPIADAPAEAVGAPCSHHEAGPASEPAGDHGNCRQFCDQERVSIRPLKTGLDDVQLHALTLPARDVVLQLPAAAPMPPWVPLREGGAAPPVAIAFLRLTL